MRTAPGPATTKILYIVGKGRSGSTLLDELLGQLDGFFSSGELRRLWSWHVRGGFPCSCGEAVSSCPVWSAVLADLDARGAVRPTVAEAITERALHWRSVGGALLGAPAQRAYGELMARLYASIARVTGAEVVVDSTKWPAHPGALGAVPGTRPSVVQLVRDPRGVTFSYRRGKETGGLQPDMPRFSALHSAVSWLARNVLAEAVLRRCPGGALRVRYEDLSRRPRLTVEALAALVGEPRVADFITDHTAKVRGSHLLGGNPDRFGRDRIEIREDGAWRELIAPGDERTVSLVTRPLLGRYGYPRRVRV